VRCPVPAPALTLRAGRDAGAARAAQAVSAEVAQRRRDELARMRSLLFHQEAKLKRLARIKSKDYHRRALRAAKAKARARCADAAEQQGCAVCLAQHNLGVLCACHGW